MTTIEAPKTTPKEVTTADVLERAIDLLGEFGWIQGELGSKAEGAMCANGAIWEALGDLGHQDEAHFRPISDSVARQILGRTSNTGDVFVVPEWNNAPERTKSEVVSLLRQAAERSRETA